MPGNVTFDGVIAAQQLIGCESWGTNPDVFQLWIQPQTSPVPTIGSLAWQYNGVGVVLDNCLVESAYFKQTTRTVTQILVIKDRRWAWGMNTITYYSDKESVASLAFRLFKAMGEPGADLSSIDPTEMYQADWDHANPADELQSMLYSFGYCVSPMGNGPAKVWKIGVGATLGNPNDVIGVSFSISAAARPATLGIVANKTAVQSKLYMEPVGLDTDKRIKPIDNLSYRPAGGWSTITDWLAMTGVSGSIARSYAKRTVGRWFRVKSQADETQLIAAPGSPPVNYVTGEMTVSSYKQLLPLFDTLIESDPATGRRLPSYCEALHYDDVNDENSPTIERLNLDWNIDNDNGVIRFKDQILVKDFTVNKTSPAKLYFNCSYSISYPDGSNNQQQKDRLSYGLPLGGQGLFELDGDDLRRELICSYADGSVAIQSISDNIATVTNEMVTRVNAYARTYSSNQRTAVFYRLIFPYTTDGITQQVVWKAGMVGTSTDPPFSTTVSQFMESHPHLIRRKEKEARVAAKRQKVANAARIRDRDDFMRGGAGLR